MNRTLKFRTWNKHEKKFSDIQFCASFDADGTVNVHYHCEINQFTGLLDKNGKEIYTGDIVKPYEFRENCQIVNELSDFYSFKIKGKHNYYTYDCRSIEIIGNIYENPELISN